MTHWQQDTIHQTLAFRYVKDHVADDTSVVVRLTKPRGRGWHASVYTITIPDISAPGIYINCTIDSVPDRLDALAFINTMLVALKEEPVTDPLAKEKK